MITIYGIKNCNSVQKSVKQLEQQGVKFEFHDYKKLGITAEQLQQWMSQVSWEVLLNKKGTTWKKLSPEEQNAIQDETSVVAALVQHTSMIKRPVIMKGKKIVAVGYDEEQIKKIK